MKLPLAVLAKSEWPMRKKIQSFIQSEAKGVIRLNKSNCDEEVTMTNSMSRLCWLKMFMSFTEYKHEIISFGGTSDVVF